MFHTAILCTLCQGTSFYCQMDINPEFPTDDPAYDRSITGTVGACNLLIFLHLIHCIGIPCIRILHVCFNCIQFVHKPEIFSITPDWKICSIATETKLVIFQEYENSPVTLFCTQFRKLSAFPKMERIPVGIQDF